jgi:hypothetical protein
LFSEKNYQSSAGQFSVLNLAFSEMKQPHRGQREVFAKLFPLVCDNVISGNNN